MIWRLRRRERTSTRGALLLWWRWGVPCAALAILVACGLPARAPVPTPTPAEPPALRRLTLANTSLGAAAPFFVAQDVGIFARHGLDVEVSAVSGVRGAQALVARQAEYALISSRTAVDAALAGAEIVMLAGITPTTTFGLYAPPEVRRVGHLRGKTIGITQLGASADFAVRYALRRHGLEADRDYTLFQTGGMSESLAALQIGAVQAAVLSPPTTAQARKAGLRQVLDITDLGIDYVVGALTTSRAFLAQEPDTNRRFLKAMLEGIYYAKTNPTATKQIMARYLPSAEDDVLEETYGLYVERLLPRVPYVSPRGVETVLDELGVQPPGASDVTAERFMDNGPLAELEASGFVRKLWGD